MAPVKEVMLPIFNEVATASEIRHDLIHGMLLSIPEEAKITEMARLLRNTKHPHKKFSVTTVQILASATAARDLGGRLLNVTIALDEVIKRLTKKREANEAE